MIRQIFNKLPKLIFISVLVLSLLISLNTPLKHPISAVSPTPTSTLVDISRNWSGYSTTNGIFTGVSATWTVPKVAASSNFGADSAWVGIGGIKSRDLIQSGTSGIVDRNGQTNYFAFFETLPDAAQTLPIDVNPGDSVTVTINNLRDGEWKVVFINNTSGEIFRMITTYNSSLSSAEWIEEDPSGVRRLFPLDNFGTISFKNAYAISNGKKVTIGQSKPDLVIMKNIAGETLARPSDLGQDGASFSVVRTNSPSIPPTTSSIYYKFPY